jgi:hypothetical protein
MIFIGFGLVSAFLTILISLKLFKSYIGWNNWNEKLSFILFIYGGGVLIISGFIYSYVNGLGFKNAALDSLMFDPGGGFWMLNFGRNFIFSTEAYYHLLTIGITYSVFKNKQAISSLLIFILAFSHPFYGIQFLILIISWQILDKFVFKNKQISTKYLIINIISLLLFIVYYKMYMTQFDSYQSIVEKWTLNWNLKFITEIFAYLPIFLFFVYQLRKKSLLINFFKNPFHRFLFLYFAGSFLLANHEMFMNPIQPIHFTHGNIYIPLFLLASKGIVSFFNNNKSTLSIVMSVLVFGILIFDNLSWFPAQYYINVSRRYSDAIRIIPTQKRIINYINENYNYNYLLLSEFATIDYYATAYTSVHSLVPHAFNTPFYVTKEHLWKQFYKEKDFSILPNHKLLIIDNLLVNGILPELQNDTNFKLMYKNKDYLLYERINN